MATMPLAEERSRPTASSRLYATLIWVGRRRRAVAGLVIAAIAAIVVLDVRGYSFTARRVAAGGIQTAVAIALAVAAYRVILQSITRNAWRCGSSQPVLGDGAYIGDGIASKSAIANDHGRTNCRAPCRPVESRR